MQPVNKNRPNWLLRGLLIVSLAVHLVVLVYIADIYNAPQLVFIELALRNISKPFGRDIPRPPIRPKPIVKPHEVNPLSVNRPIPQFKPLKIDSFDSSLPDSIAETLSVPEIASTPREFGKISDSNIADYTSPRDYLEMVRNTIQRHKQYPQRARSRQVEGRVTLQFVIHPDGTLQNATVIKSSRHEVLDEAALQALQRSAPFQPPPQRFFKGPVPVQITIAFELTAA